MLASTWLKPLGLSVAQVSRHCAGRALRNCCSNGRCWAWMWTTEEMSRIPGPTFLTWPSAAIDAVPLRPFMFVKVHRFGLIWRCPVRSLTG